MTFTLNEPPVNFVGQCDFERVGKTIVTSTTGGIFVYGQKDFDDIEVQVEVFSGGVHIAWHTPTDFGQLDQYDILVDGILGADTGYRVLVRDKNNPSTVITGSNEWFMGDVTLASGQSNQNNWRNAEDNPDAQIPSTFTRAISSPFPLLLEDAQRYLPTPSGNGIRRFMNNRHAETGRAISYIDFSVGGAGIQALAGELPLPSPTAGNNYIKITAEYAAHAKSLPSTMVFQGTEADTDPDTRWSADMMPRGDWVRTFRRYKKNLFNDLSNKKVSSDNPLVIITPLGCISQSFATSKGRTEASWNEIRQANADVAIADADCVLGKSAAASTNDAGGAHYTAASYATIARSSALLLNTAEGGGDNGFVPPVVASIVVVGADVQITTDSPSGDSLGNFGGFDMWDILQDGTALVISAIAMVGQRIDITVAGYNSALPLEVRFAYTYLNITFTDTISSGGGKSLLGPTRMYSDQSWLLDGVTKH